MITCKIDCNFHQNKHGQCLKCYMLICKQKTFEKVKCPQTFDGQCITKATYYINIPKKLIVQYHNRDHCGNVSCA